MIFAELRQHPVGQGGLLSGRVTIYGNEFSWIYDCGSEQSDSLSREIRKVAGSHFQLGFLSHLHDDHVNGFEEFLSVCTVQEVILPHLNDHERILAAGIALARGKLTGNFLNFIANPAAWLINRGVERVTFIRGPDSDETTEGSDDPVEPTLGIEGPLTTKWSRPRELIKEKGAPEGAGTVQNGSILHVVDPHGSVADWIFCPQVHRPSASRATAFSNMVRAKFPGQKLKYVIDACRNADGRRLLRECYDRIARDHNNVSMSLYSGPHSLTSHSDWVHSIARGHREIRWGNGRAGGWLSAGDANLASLRRLDQFRNHFARYLPDVLVFVAPHHGSSLNFDTDLLRPMGRLKIGIAAAGPNGYGHPHKFVRDSINAWPGARFFKVGKRRKSAITFRLWRR